MLLFASFKWSGRWADQAHFGRVTPTNWDRSRSSGWHGCGRGFIFNGGRTVLRILRTPEIRGRRPKEKRMNENKTPSGAAVPCIDLLGNSRKEQA